MMAELLTRVVRQPINPQTSIQDCSLDIWPWIIHLGESTIFVRGLHLSPLCSDTDFEEKLAITPDNNPYDPNDIKIMNGEGIFVGHIAII